MRLQSCVNGMITARLHHGGKHWQAMFRGSPALQIFKCRGELHDGFGQFGLMGSDVSQQLNMKRLDLQTTAAYSAHPHIKGESLECAAETATVGFVKALPSNCQRHPVGRSHGCSIWQEWLPWKRNVARPIASASPYRPIVLTASQVAAQDGPDLLPYGPERDGFDKRSQHADRFGFHLFWGHARRCRP